MDKLPELRSRCLAFLLCEVSVRLVAKVKNQDQVVSLQLQFIHMFKDFLLEKVPYRADE
jgi:hypothetical protein